MNPETRAALESYERRLRCGQTVILSVYDLMAAWKELADVEEERGSLSPDVIPGLLGNIRKSNVAIMQGLHDTNTILQELIDQARLSLEEASEKAGDDQTGGPGPPATQ